MELKGTQYDVLRNNMIQLKEAQRALHLKIQDIRENCAEREISLETLSSDLD